MMYWNMMVVVGFAAMFCGNAQGQSFNIDIDSPASPGAFGGGAPSSSYGAAAGQTGVWNAIPPNNGPLSLVTLSGEMSNATLSVIEGTIATSVLSWFNPNNVGDYALLMNDAAQVGTTSTGGAHTYSFDGLLAGMYAVYTYAAPPMGSAGSLSIHVANSSEGTLTSSGAMSPNTFTLGVSHVIHTVEVFDGNITIRVVDTPGAPPGFVNGFQFVLVPTPASLCIFAAGAVFRTRRRR